jgi:hypothetical protein
LLSSLISLLYPTVFAKLLLSCDATTELVLAPAAARLAFLWVLLWSMGCCHCVSFVSWFKYTHCSAVCTHTIAQRITLIQKNISIIIYNNEIEHKKRTYTVEAAMLMHLCTYSGKGKGRGPYLVGSLQQLSLPVGRKGLVYPVYCSSGNCMGSIYCGSWRRYSGTGDYHCGTTTNNSGSAPRHRQVPVRLAEVVHHVAAAQAASHHAGACRAALRVPGVRPAAAHLSAARSLGPQGRSSSRGRLCFVRVCA